MSFRTLAEKCLTIHIIARISHPATFLCFCIGRLFLTTRDGQKLINSDEEPKELRLHCFNISYKNDTATQSIQKLVQWYEKCLQRQVSYGIVKNWIFGYKFNLLLMCFVFIPMTIMVFDLRALCNAFINVRVIGWQNWGGKFYKDRISKSI